MSKSSEYYQRNKETIKEKARLYRIKNRDRILAQRKKYYAKITPEQRLKWRLSTKRRNPESIKNGQKRYYNSHKEKYMAYKMKDAYGLELNDYYALVTKQNGLCAICGEKPKQITGKSRRLHIDHDHATGKIRGLLCHKCNNGLGCMDDNIQKLESAIKYLNGQM